MLKNKKVINTVFLTPKSILKKANITELVKSTLKIETWNNFLLF